MMLWLEVFHDPSFVHPIKLCFLYQKVFYHKRVKIVFFSNIF